MAFDSFADFLAMGRHGFYVWSAYGFSILVLVALTCNTLITRRKVRKKLHKRLIRDQII
jgi:heme exporter protein D